MPEVIRNANVTIAAGGSTEVAIEQYGCQRAFIAITNLEAVGGNDMFLIVGEQAAANKGLKLAPGQTYYESMDAGYKPTNKAFNVYCAGASSVAVQERIFTR